MLHIITSNAVPVKNIKEYNDNFVICHLFQKEMNGSISLVNLPARWIGDQGIR